MTEDPNTPFTGLGYVPDGDGDRGADDGPQRAERPARAVHPWGSMSPRSGVFAPAAAILGSNPLLLLIVVVLILILAVLAMLAGWFFGKSNRA